ncbi:hypothetical protein C8F01DRAFT_1259685 [Mycena amicta]|nr:hypothetical protein C8F01DRAFT_1259685 [Mycena amicta]
MKPKLSILLDDDKHSPNICHPSINGSTTFRFTGTRIAVYGTSFPQQKSTNFRIYEDQPEGNLNSTFTNGYIAISPTAPSGIDGQVLFYTSSLPDRGPQRDDRPELGTAGAGLCVTQAAVSATTATATSTITSTSLLPPKSPSSTSKASNAEHKALIIIPIALTLGLLLALGYILYLRRRAKRRQLDVETPAPGEPDPDAGMDDDWQAMYTPRRCAYCPQLADDTVQSRFYEPLDWMGSTRSSGTTATMSNVYGFPKTRDSDISGSGFEHSESSTSSIRDDDASSITQTAYAI